MLDKKRITIYVTQERFEAVKKLAKKEERSTSSMIDRIFMQYIALKKK